MANLLHILRIVFAILDDSFYPQMIHVYQFDSHGNPCDRVQHAANAMD